MSNPLISVIIPVYKVEDYLERCLESVINNTYMNLEIICVNDGSPDNCQCILEQYAAQDSRIKVIVQTNQGLSAARNTGIDNASGEYLYYLDSDDWIHERAFEFLLRAARESGADIVVGGYKRVFYTETFLQKTEAEYPAEVVAVPAKYFAESSGHYRDMVWGILYHNDAVRGVRFPPGKVYGEDAFYKTILLSSQAALSVAFLDSDLYYYVSRPDSIMNSVSADIQFSNIKWWSNQLNQFVQKEFVLSNLYRYIFFYRYQGIFYANPDVAKKNVRRAIAKLRPYFISCRTMSKKQRLRILLSVYMPGLYRILLVYRDPSYKDWEATAKIRYKNEYLKKWDEV